MAICALLLANIGTTGCGRCGFQLLSGDQADAPIGQRDAALDASGRDASSRDAANASADADTTADALQVGAVVVVTTTADNADGDTTSIGNLQASPGADGRISLREAMLATNATSNGSGVDAIHFEIIEAPIDGAHTIVVSAGGLPPITDPVVIDGHSDSHFAGTPVIELDMSVTGTGDRMVLDAGSAGSVIRGLVINGGNDPIAPAIDIRSDGNLITDCYIGTDPTGTMSAWVFKGILVGGSGNEIRNNLIARYSSSGIDTAAGNGTVIRGNYIGTNPAGTDLGGDWGIFLRANHGDTIIGGVNANEGNVIANNLTDGVIVLDSTGHSIIGNRIFDNQAGGIDFSGNGDTPNDLGDADTGPNNQQNYPVLSSASTNGTSTINIAGTLNSTALTTFRIELFSSTTDNRQGEFYLGATTVTTDASGNADFAADLAQSVPAGAYITSTATVQLGPNDHGDTSEFSASVTAN